MSPAIPSISHAMSTVTTWSVERVGRNSFHAKIFLEDTTLKPDFHFRCLLSFDRHHDNPKCIQSLEKKHLDEVKDWGTFCLDGGDLFCAMQGKGDPRAVKGQTRNEDEGEDYFDRLVNSAATFYEPYLAHMPVLGLGNHETSVLKHHGVNLTKRLATELTNRSGGKYQVFDGGYTTFVKFTFYCKSTKESGYIARDTKLLRMFHGAGGDAPMSFGTLNVKREAAHNPDPDIFASGHSHNEFAVGLARLRVSDHGILYLDDNLHLKVPTYKEEYGDGYKGFHVEKNRPPKPIGATWLIFKTRAPYPAERKAGRKDRPIYCDSERAK